MKSRQAIRPIDSFKKTVQVLQKFTALLKNSNLDDIVLIKQRGSCKYFSIKVWLMARDFVLIFKSVYYSESFLSGTISSFIRPVINTQLLGLQ